MGESLARHDDACEQESSINGAPDRHWPRDVYENERARSLGLVPPVRPNEPVCQAPHEPSVPTAQGALSVP